MLENFWNIIWTYGCSPIQPWPHSGTYVSTFKGSRVPLPVLKFPKLEDYLAELNGDKNFLKAFLNLLPLYKSGNLIFFENGSYQIRKNIWYWNGNFTSIVFCQTYIFFNRILHPIQTKFFFLNPLQVLSKLSSPWTNTYSTGRNNSKHVLFEIV